MKRIECHYKVQRIYQDISNVEDLKTVAFEANLLQANVTIQTSVINGLNENCKGTVIYNASIALIEVERGLMTCSLNGEFPEMQHGWIAPGNG